MRRSWPCFLDPCAMYFCSSAYDYYTPRHRRRFHWVEFWIFADTWYPLYPQKKIQIQMMTAFVVHGATSSSPVNLTLHVFLILCMGHMTFPRDWLLFGCTVCPLFSRSPICWGFTSDWLCCEPFDSAWCGLLLPWCGPIVGWCEPDSSILCTKPKSLSDQIKQFPTDGANCKGQIWLESSTGMDLGPKNLNNKFVESGRKS